MFSATNSHPPPAPSSPSSPRAGFFRADNQCGGVVCWGMRGICGVGGSGGMDGKGARMGLGSRGGGWVVWFIVLMARSDSRGVFGAFGAWVGFGGCRLAVLWEVMLGYRDAFACGDFVLKSGLVGRFSLDRGGGEGRYIILDRGLIGVQGEWGVEWGRANSWATVA